MQKITQKDRQHFLKTQPFNFCDQFCERCSEMKHRCQVYREDVEYKMECIRKGENPNDPRIFFKRINRMIGEVQEMIEKEAKKTGLDVSVEIKKIRRAEFIRQDKKIEKHPFFKRTMKLSFETQKFLLEFEPGNLSEPLPWMGKFWMKEMEEMAFYAPLIFAKAARAVSALVCEMGPKKERNSSDRLTAAALSYYSMLTVERSFREIYRLIRREEPIWALKIGKLLRSFESAKKSCRETFPEVEKFKDKIIFHGNIESCS